MKKILAYVAYIAIYAIFTFVIAISFIATICGDGDKGLFDLFK